jgi:small subunit ribosomal protein S14
MSTNAKEIKQKKLKLFSKFSTKPYNRCRLCGRARGYMRRFDMCRICFRKLAHQGDLPGVTKSSW